MKIRIETAVFLLDKATVGISESGDVCQIHIGELNGEPDNEFAYFEWTDEDGLGYDVKCMEENNAEVELNGNELILADTEGDKFAISLLGPLPGEAIAAEFEAK